MDCTSLRSDRRKDGFRSLQEQVPTVHGLQSRCQEKQPRAVRMAYILVTPYYNKATQTGLIAHYKAIAAETKAPIILYSVASRTGVNIEPSTVATLAKETDNIVAVKEASGNISQVAKILQLTDGKVDVYSGNDDQIVPILSLGGKGVILYCPM